jgi:dTDP-4-dehydrorhamnose reductase
MTARSKTANVNGQLATVIANTCTGAGAESSDDVDGEFDSTYKTDAHVIPKLRIPQIAI